MRVSRLWLTDFRNYQSADVVLAPDGLTVVIGGNGDGKTNLLEAVGYLASLQSFRSAPTDALIRAGATEAVVRAEGDRDGRQLLIEAQIAAVGRGRVLVNRQPLRRARDLLGALRVTVFSPDDLELVKDGPAHRRRYIDDLLVALHPRHDALIGDLERVLRQRNALLRQVGGRLDTDAATTLDVWDERLAAIGEELAAARVDLASQLDGEVAKAYDQVAATAAVTSLGYQRSWGEAGGLAEALVAARPDDLRRGVTTVGPHRDDLALSIAGLPARTHASQGEQRSLALALRLAGHAVVTEALDSPPILLLDDVFSELDPARSEALVAHIPAGQALLTTAGALPQGLDATVLLRISDGRVVA